jgi:hypothetical protein
MESGALQIGVAKYEDAVSYGTGISYTSVLAGFAIFFYMWGQWCSLRATDSVLRKMLAPLMKVLGVPQPLQSI